MKEFFFFLFLCIFCVVFYLAGMRDAATDFSLSCEQRGFVVIDKIKHYCI